MSASISHVSSLRGLGRCNYTIRCYLGDATYARRAWVQTHELKPRSFELCFEASIGCHQAEIPNIRIGTELSFQVEGPDQQRIPWVPIEEPETIFGKVRVPDLDPTWRQQTSNTTASTGPIPRFQIMLESTLEGLLADYQGGAHAPDAIEELLELSIAARINQTMIPERLAEMGYTELMVPIFSSVADRTKLDPKFNYLVYNLSLDWQLGTHREMRKLVHKFRHAGIELVPDLVFAHQVSDPYNGSVSDWFRRSQHESAYRDTDPYLFRDYGTWMFNLTDSHVRKVIIEKILQLIISLDLRKIRVDYIDGLVLQYSRRPQNWGCVLLDELHEALTRHHPDLEIIGEAFSTASVPQVQRLISSSYSPRGFKLMEVLLSPIDPNSFDVGARVDSICESLIEANHQSKHESNYTQLHDECWKDLSIEQGRPSTPWAYGKMPLGLALDHCQHLLEHQFIAPDQGLPTSIRLTALISVLGMVMSFRRWMETVGTISLDTGGLDEEDHWMFLWSPSDRLNQVIWEHIGSNVTFLATELLAFRESQVAIRRALLELGPATENPPGPPLQLVHRDRQNGLIGLLRWGCRQPTPLLIFANLTPYRFNQNGDYVLQANRLDWLKAEAMNCFARVGRDRQRLKVNPDQSIQVERVIEPYEVAVFGART